MDIQQSAPLSGPASDSPRPFHEIPPLWLRLFHMDEPFFAAEMPHSGSLNTFLSVLVYAAFATLCVVITSVARDLLASPQAISIAALALLMSSCFTLIGGPLAFYLNTGIYYLSALAFGGKGTFTRQAYLHTLYFVPLSVIASLFTFLQLIPRSGIYLSFALLPIIVVVDVIFQVRSFKVVHGFTTGRAAAAVLTPLFLIFGCICLAVILIVALALADPTIGNVLRAFPTPAP